MKENRVVSQSSRGSGDSDTSAPLVYIASRKVIEIEGKLTRCLKAIHDCEYLPQRGWVQNLSQIACAMFLGGHQIELILYCRHRVSLRICRVDRPEFSRMLTRI